MSLGSVVIYCTVSYRTYLENKEPVTVIFLRYLWFIILPISAPGGG
jgi:hypothetical protein